MIIGADHEVIAKGCNCMPNGCEGKLPWDRTGPSETDTKYPFGEDSDYYKKIVSLYAIIYHL